MKLLELFAGSRSVGKEAEKLGFQVFSSDINDFDGIDYVTDILNFDINKLPFKPTVIWASPPCTTYSLLQVRHHRDNTTPKTKDAELADVIVKHTLNLIKELQPKYWYIENPRAMLRKMPFMSGLPRATVWYCKYGDHRAKPTDIWSNNIFSLFNTNGWQPRPKCFNGNTKCHHNPAPRGSTTGTQGFLTDYERSIIPGELGREIMQNSK
tara:strand:+ start:562 stop:1191 length:630 start_codon:yes stop_codon:yes gene_type:complete